jgi:hypothetical protein
MGIDWKGDAMTALSKQQASDFKACVQIVRKGINTFREVGQALAKIRDEQWYKTSHKTFEAFCIAEFGFKRSHAYRLIDAAKAVEMSPVGDKMTTERQARKYLDEQKQPAKPKPATPSRAVVAELDFDDEHHPVAGDSDDNQDADGGAARVTGGQLAEMEPDPVGVSSKELDRVRWAQDEFEELWQEYQEQFGESAAWCYFSTAWERFKELAGYE